MKPTLYVYLSNSQLMINLLIRGKYLDMVFDWGDEEERQEKNQAFRNTVRDRLGM